MSAHVPKAGADRSPAQGVAVLNESGKENDGSDDGTEQEIRISDTDSTAREIEREYFKILRKQNVRYDRREKRYKLKYFTGDAPTFIGFVPLKNIKTEHSKDDDHLKRPFARYCYYVLLAAIISLFSADLLHAVMRVLHSESFCPSQPGFFSLSCAQLVGPFLVIVVGSFVLSLRFMYLSKHIENNFVNIDAQWQNAIDQFFAFDVYSKMMGVRLCMLKFRQFIKWRRFANFFLKLFVASAISFFGLAVALALALHKLQATEVLTSLGFLAGLVLVMRWFLNQRFKHTEWRDPTVQLCVMIAELHQRLIERGATMVEEIDHST